MTSKEALEACRQRIVNEINTGAQVRPEQCDMLLKLNAAIDGKSRIDQLEAEVRQLHAELSEIDNLLQQRGMRARDGWASSSE